MILLNGIKEREKKEVMKENKKILEIKQVQKDLRDYLAVQVQEKKLGILISEFSFLVSKLPNRKRIGKG